MVASEYTVGWSLVDEIRALLAEYGARRSSGGACRHPARCDDGRERTEAEIVASKAGDAERNERARREILRRDGARSPSENLAEGVALARFAGALFGKASRARAS